MFEVKYWKTEFFNILLFHEFLIISIWLATHIQKPKIREDKNRKKIYWGKKKANVIKNT